MPFDKKDIPSDSISTATACDVDGAVGVPKTHWYVAIVNSRHEKSVGEKLAETGLETYVAIQKEIRVWKNGRRKLVDRVVIPSLVFVKCTEKKRREIVNLPFINRFMVNRMVETGGLNKPAAIITDPEIQKMKFMLGQSEQPVDFIPTIFRVNDNVKVIRGKLAGLEGEITANSDGTHTLLVSLSILGGATVRIDPQDVEKIRRSTDA